MAFRTAENGCEPGDLARVHQRGIRRTEFLCQDDTALRQAGKSAERRLGQIADQTGAGFAHIVGARRRIGVRQVFETVRDVRYFGLHGSFGIDTLFGDTTLHTAHQARSREHL